MRVFVVGADHELPGIDSLERRAKPIPKRGVIASREKAAGLESLDMTKAPKHVPSKQSRIPEGIVSDGVAQHERVGSGALAPERGRFSLHWRKASASRA